MKTLRFSVLILIFFSQSLYSATVTWNGAGDGVSWGNPANWLGGLLPSNGDDAIIGSGAAVTISDNYTVASLQSQRAISITSGSLTVTSGNSEVKGALTLAPRTTIGANGPGAIFLCTNTVSADGAGFSAQNGGIIRLPGFKNYSKPDGCYEVYWYANGAGSTVDLASLTNVSYGGNCGYTHSQGINGGQIILSNLLSIATAATFEAYVDGSNSLVNLKNLTSFPGAGGWLSLEARNSAQIIIPNLVDGVRTGLTLRNGGVVNTVQIARIGGVTVDNQSLTLPALTNIDGNISLSVYNGGHLTLPLVKTFTKTDGCYEVYWYANGTGSVLDLSSLTNLLYGGNCGYTHAQGVSGGQVILSNLVSVATAATFEAYVDGASSLVDLRNLASFPGSGGWFNIEARNTGQILVPKFVDGIRAGLTLRNGGSVTTRGLTRIGGITIDNQVASFPTITNIDGNISLYVHNGGSLSLPSILGYSKTDGCYDNYWYADGTGSVLNLTSLTNISYGGNCGYSHAQGINGGVILLSNLVSMSTNVLFQAYADGSGSVVDLRKLAVFPTATGYLDIQARNSGQVILPLLVDGSRASFTLINGGTLNTAQLTRIGGVYVDNTTLVLPAVTNVDGNIGLSVNNGGNLSLPLVTSYSKLDGCYDNYWYANGAGAVLNLSSLTNISYGGNCGYTRAQAINGGSVILSNLLAMGTNVQFQAYADGGGSVVDLRKLAVFPTATGYLDLQARNTGQVILPLLVDGSRASITVINNGTMNTAQLKRIGGVYVDNTTLVLPAITNIDGNVGLSVNNGGNLSLPLVTNYSKLDGCYDIYWYANGAGAVLNLSSIKSISYGGNCGYLRAQAINGGNVILSNLVSFATNTQLQAYGDGANSLVDLSSASVFPTNQGWLDLQARNTARVKVPLLVDGTRAGMTFINAGVIDIAQLARLGGLYENNNTNIFSSLTNMDSSSVNLYAGAKVTMPLLASLAKVPGCANYTWQVSDAGSQLVLPVLSKIVSLDACGGYNFQAVSGGSLVMSNLVSIAGPYCALLSDGGGSVLDLSKLNSFIAPLNQSSALTAQNGGVILLGSQAFLLANVNVTIAPGNPILPPSVVSGPNLTLYGTPWRSYLVEQQNTLVAGAPWSVFARVPLTNSFQRVSGPPPANTAFRVSEFNADPSIVGISSLAGHQTQLVLFGVNSNSYQLQTTTNIVDPLSWTSLGSPLAFTNSFQILAPSTASDPQRYFRAKKL